MLLPVAKAILIQAGKELTKTSLKGVAARIGSVAERKALAEALGRAFAEVDRKTDQRFTDWDITEVFWEHEGATELAKVLIPGVEPSPVTLATAAVDSLGKRRSDDERFDRILALRPAFTVLLESLDREIRSEDALRDFLGRSDAADTAIAAGLLARHLGAGAAGEDDRAHYLSWIIDQSRYLKTAGMVRTKTVPLRLAEVFVGLRAERDQNPGDRARNWFEQERAKLAARLAAGELDSIRFEAALDQLQIRYGRKFAADRETAAEQVLPVLDIIRDTAHVLVLGDPGSGKTTLLHYLALTHARALREGGQVDGMAARFPVYFRISEYAQHGFPGAAISDFLPAYLRRMECRAVNGSDLLRAELEAGRCLVLLDGLDEVASADLRRGVVGAVVNFVNAYARYGNRFVVTSRIAGYQAAPLPEPFQAARLREMDDEAITRFLEVYCREVERAETSEKTEAAIHRAAAKEAAAIGEALQTNAGVRRLAANPLLLTALVLVHRASGRLPHRRIEAYVEVCGALGHTWRNAQGVAKADLPDERILQEWLSALGAWLHANRPEGAASLVELLSVLGPLWARHEGKPWDPEVLRSADPMSSDAGIAVAKFVEKADHHTGLLVERAPGRYGFAHLTFEEFYTGRAIAWFGSEADRLATIRRHLHDPRYEEPILLALGLIGSTQYGQVENVIAQAIWPAADSPSPYEEILGRDFLFMVRVLADNPPIAAGVINKVVHTAITEYLDPQTSRCRFDTYRDALTARIAGLAGTEAGKRLVAALETCAAHITGAQMMSFCELAQTARKIGNLGTATVATLLRIIVSSDDPAIRMTAVEALPPEVSSAEPVIEALITMTADTSDEESRYRALCVAFAGAFNEAQKIAVLRETLDEPNDRVRLTVAQASAVDRASGELAVTVLVACASGGGDPEPRLRAVDMLQHLPDNIAANARLATEADDPLVRAQAMANLPFGEDSVLLAAELASLGGDALEADMDPAATLSRINTLTEPVRAAVLSLIMKHGDSETRIRMVDLLSYQWTLTEQEAADLARLVASDDDIAIRARVAGVLAYNDVLPDAVVLDLSTFVAGENSVEVRAKTYGVLARHGRLTGRALGAAIDFIAGDGDQYLRASVVRSLGAQDSLSDVTVSALISLATSTDHHRVRASAIAALGAHGKLTEPVVSSAVQLIGQSDDTDIQDQVMNGLVRLEDPAGSVIDAARHLVQSAESWVARRNAVRLLSRAASAEELIESLPPLFRDVDNDVRRAAGEALLKISRREPDLAPAIEAALVAACIDPELAEPDRIEDRSGWDYAYGALKLQLEVTGEEPPEWW